MRYYKGYQFKIISGADAFDFEVKLNSALQELSDRGIAADVQTDPSAGFIAYIKYQEQRRLPETISEEYELVGEKHTCLECPYYRLPTDGRIKYTKCEKEGVLCSKNRACCDFFYEELRAGRIVLRDAWKGEQR